MQESIGDFVNPEASEQTHEISLEALVAVLDHNSKFNFTSLIVMMENSLTNSDNKIRERSTLLLSELLVNCKSLSLDLNDLKSLIIFFVARLSDQPSVQFALSSICIILSRYYIYEEDIDNNLPRSVLLSLLVNIHIPSYSQAVRKIAFDIIEGCLDSKMILRLIICMNEDLLTGFARSIDGEKDPRCLVQCFRIAAKILDLYKDTDVISEEAIEEIFDSLACYFPISFKPPISDPFKISPQQLSDLLHKALVSHPLLHYHTIPLILDKLEAASLSSLSLTSKCLVLTLLKLVLTSSSSSINPIYLHMEGIISSLARISTSSSELALVSAVDNALSLSCHIITTSGVQPFDKLWSVFVDHIIGPCSILMKRSLVNVFGRSAARCMLSLSSSSSLKVMSKVADVVRPMVNKHVRNACVCLGIDCIQINSSDDDDDGCCADDDDDDDDGGSCCKGKDKPSGGRCCKDDDDDRMMMDVTMAESSLIPCLELIIGLFKGIDGSVSYSSHDDGDVRSLRRLASDGMIILSTLLSHATIGGNRHDLTQAIINTCICLLSSSCHLPLLSRSDVLMMMTMIVPSISLTAVIKTIMSKSKVIRLYDGGSVSLSGLIYDIIISPALSSSSSVNIHQLCHISLLLDRHVVSQVYSHLCNIDEIYYHSLWGVVSRLIYDVTFSSSSSSSLGEEESMKDNIKEIYHQLFGNSKAQSLFIKSMTTTADDDDDDDDDDVTLEQSLTMILVCMPEYDIDKEIYISISQQLFSSGQWDNHLSAVFVNCLPVTMMDEIMGPHLTVNLARLMAHTCSLSDNYCIIIGLLLNKLNDDHHVKQYLLEFIASQDSMKLMTQVLRFCFMCGSPVLFCWAADLVWVRLTSSSCINNNDIDMDRIMQSECLGFVNPLDLVGCKLSLPLRSIKTRVVKSNLFWRQKLFSVLYPRLIGLIPPDIGNTIDSNYPLSKSSLLSLIQLANNVPEPVMLETADRLVTALVVCLIWCKNNALDANELQSSSCRLLASILESKQETNQVALYLTTISACLVSIATLHPNARTRLCSLQCLKMTAAFPYARVHESRLGVLRNLVPVLNDKKRAVRQLAAQARNEWFIVGQE